ncbi:MAG: hypothetical protein K9L76_00630 [Candidatus Omnitrophica bacterium]|nr:hypothetical protein [Candidatus Omnitrophota bacterium]
MKILVIYYSRTGVTKKLANHIAENIACDIEEIIDLKNRSGAKGYFIGAKDAAAKKSTRIKEPDKDPVAYDLIAIGTPVWAFTMAPAVRAYIENNSNKFKSVAFFCTEGGSGARRTFKDMEELCKKKPKETLALKEREVKKNSYGLKIEEFINRMEKGATPK